MKRRLVVLCLAVATLMPAAVRGTTFTVTRTEDSGAGTLRQAILDANAHAGSDTVVFHIPIADSGLDLSTGTWNIRPRAELPELQDRGTVIDGETQTAFIGSDSNPKGPVIVVDGGSAGNTSGIILSGQRHTLRNIIIHRFRYRQVYITGDSNRVTGCYLGCDATGTVSMGVSDGGLLIEDGHWNVIGGSAVSDGNVIGGNSDEGLEITYLSANNRVEGNLIGVRADGSGALSNGKGVALTNGCRSNSIGPGNVISGNRQNGVILMGTGTSMNVVAGNLIGPAPGGIRSIGNGDDGVLLVGVSANRIGGSAAAGRNVISGNLYSGVALRGERCDSNRVQGNFIGLDGTGRVTMSNGENGVTITSGPRSNRIGGAQEAEANVIGGNLGHGIQIYGLGTEVNLVLGNRIGTAADGKTQAPNFMEGVSISSGAAANRVGPLNLIAFNLGNGVSIAKAGTVSNAVTWNSIHSNMKRGIRTSEGGNLDLAPPVLVSVNPVTGTAVAGSRVEIFSDSSDEGRVFETAVTADASGHFSWAGVPAGPYVTATVTDTAGNTSEFSDAYRLTAVSEERAGLPGSFFLSQNRPNPFNPATVIRYGVRTAGRVELRVFDVTGRRVATPVSGFRPAGEYEVTFDGSGLPSGVYIFRMDAAGFTAVRKMVMME
jgi:hypothetical protein